MTGQTYKGKTFLEYANGAAAGIRETGRMLCGMGSPEDGSLLGDVGYCVYIMVQMYLASVTGKKIASDELNNITTDLMFAGKEELESIVKKYCNDCG